MAPIVAPDLTPAFNRDKQGGAGAAQRKGGNPLILVLALALILLVGAGLWRMFRAPARSDAIVNVVAAADDLPPGCRLGFTSLHYTKIPKTYVTPDMITASNLAAGQVTRYFIARGEPIRTSDLFPSGSGLAPSLGPDERALTLDLADDGLVDHNISPGDRVDVLATMGRNGRKLTRTVCQDVLVLMAVPRQALLSRRLRAAEMNRITLAVTPEQGETLVEASELGKLRLTLRSRLSRNTLRLPGISEEDLLPATAGNGFARVASAIERPLLPPPPPTLGSALQPPPATASPEPFKWVVEVFSGSKKETHEFLSTP